MSSSLQIAIAEQEFETAIDSNQTLTLYHRHAYSTTGLKDEDRWQNKSPHPQLILQIPCCHCFLI